MGLFLVTLMVVTALTATLVVVAFADVSSSSRAASRAQAAELATSALEEFYARLSYQEGFLEGLVSVTPSASHPAWGSTSGTENWARISQGAPQPCPDGYQDPCYRVATSVQFSDTGAPIGLLVDVTARAGCSGRLENCQVVRTQQRLRARQFFDYLFFTYRNTLSPSLYPGITQNQAEEIRAACSVPAALRADPRCLDVAYLGRGPARPESQDLIAGPVYTSDDWILVCGDPQFLDTVEVGGTGTAQGTVWKSASEPPRSDSCYSGGNPRGSSPVFLGPGGDTRVNTGRLEIPTVFTTVEEAQSLPGARVISPPAGVTTLVFTTTLPGPTRMSVGGAALEPLPQSGVIVVNGDVSVKGTVSGRLTVFATGKIEIDGDLSYAGGTDGNTTDLTSLVAGGGISILQPAAAGETRTVHALLMSLEAGVFTQGWDSSPPRWTATDVPPTLKLYGAVASRFQGVFAGYDAGTGAILNGYRKDFTFDDRPQRGIVTPPFLVSPTEASWLRLDLSDVPACQDKSSAFLADFCP